MEMIRDKIRTISGSFAMLGVLITDEQSRDFLRYLDMILLWNARVNLTAITGFEDMVNKHLLDSCAPVLFGDILRPEEGQTVVDVGSGAGLPGIPLQILYPELKVTMMDSLGKRVRFIQAVIDELGLKNAKAVHFRAEDAGRDKEHREKYDLCVSRAVSNLTVLSEFCLPLVAPGGRFVAYKTDGAEREYEKARYAVSVLGGGEADIRHFVIPNTDFNRSFVVIDKKKPTPEFYPRKAGMAAKNPLEQKKA